MVGRDHERAELAAALADARQGRGRVALLLGEAGMGGTRSCGVAGNPGDGAGVRVVRGECSAAGGPPLWPWQRALGTLVSRVTWQAEGRPKSRRRRAASWSRRRWWRRLPPRPGLRHW